MANTTKQPHVFLSYSSRDKSVAERIFQELRNRGINVWLDTMEVKPGDSITDFIHNALSASDFLLVLLSSDSTKSRWVQYELSLAANKELVKRDITLLPVLISEVDIPSSLKAYKFFDLRQDFEQGIAELAEQIGSVPEMDFSRLDPQTFERLIADLLAKLGFENIIQQRGPLDIGIDFQAEYSVTDPFGVPTKQTWLVEAKFYKQSRADLKSLTQLMAYISSLPSESQGLLVTNGQLTSIAQRWLDSTRRVTGKQLRIIDGTELKRLLLNHRDIIKRYFS